MQPRIDMTPAATTANTHRKSCYGIIPARYGSSRFPGKPLADILGRPMFWHVHRRASLCPGLGRVVLATDDERIRSAAESLDVPVVMTAADHPSGTDRVLEAAERIGVPEDAVVVNIQGDEPLLDPEMITRVLAPFEKRGVEVATLAYPLPAGQAADPDRVKVVFDRRNTTGRTGWRWSLWRRRPTAHNGLPPG